MLKGVTHVMIVACYHPLPLSACMVYFDLVSILFGTSIPTSFSILVKMFLHFMITELCLTHLHCDIVPHRLPPQLMDHYYHGQH